MKLTRQEAIEKHREMWHEIARRTMKEKRIVNKTEILGKEKLYCNCYLCEYDFQKRREYFLQNYHTCSFCPLCKEKYCCLKDCLGGLFEKWAFSQTYAEAAKYAEEIANLPDVNFKDMEVSHAKE